LPWAAAGEGDNALTREIAVGSRLAGEALTADLVTVLWLVSESMEGLMKCPECLGVNDNEATTCKSCGYRFRTQEASPDTHENFIGRYFGFRKLITPALIKFSYLVGALAITFCSVIGIFFPNTFTAYGRDSTRVVLIGILVLVFGNLAWRMLCEGAILLFSLHEILLSLDDKAELLATNLEQQDS
jgi:hypothetical protein